MTRARMPRPHEVAAARLDPRLQRAVAERGVDPAWRTRGACQTVDPETFFPAPSEPADAAVALCRTCDVQGACLAWALEVGDCHGVWGATTPRERRAMLVAWRSDLPGLVPDDGPLLMPLIRMLEPRPLDARATLPGQIPVQRAARDPVGATAI
jgi:hypothetical protein